MGNMLAWLIVCLFTVVSHAETIKNPCDFGQSTRVNQGDLDLAKKVESIFSISCQGCHGLGKPGGAGVMTDIMSRDLVVSEGMVSLTDPSNSKIMKAINRPTRWMPLGGAQLPDSDKQALLAWISGGAPDWKGSVPSSDPILTHLQEAECAAYDQANLTPREAVYYRYLTFGHLKGKDFTLARDGAIKAMNSVSFANSGYIPKSVDSLGKILRLDLRELGYLDVNAWEHEVIPGYPYAYVSFDDKLFNFYVEKLNKYAYSERASIRGEWFTQQVLQSPTYERILHIPSKFEQFEQHVLKIDAEHELLYGYGLRSGVTKSGVANYSRLYDRLEFDFIGAGHQVGYHYKTYDFNGDKGTRNTFAFPFGPRILPMYFGWDQAKFFAHKVFENDAGEVITQMPNGLQMYQIVNAKNEFINAADPRIAIDRVGSLYDDGVVRNPMSCFKCHAGGLNPTDDDAHIRHIQKAADFTVEEVKFAEQLFTTSDIRKKNFGADIAAYKKAMESLGLKDASYLTPGGEPVTSSFRKYEAYLSCKDLAWELGIKYDELIRFLQHSPDLARELGLADCETGQLSRQNYEHLFDKIIRDFYIGERIKVGGHVVVDKCKYVYANHSGVNVRFRAAYSGKVESVTLAHNTSKAFEFDAKIDGLISDIYQNTTGSWWTYNERWTVSGCRNYQFTWSNGRVVFARE